MPAPECNLLHEWLRHSASATPDAIAIAEEENLTSFGELFARAQALALCLCSHGIQPRDRICLALPKTSDAIVSIFASLLAGAIYVPIIRAGRGSALMPFSMSVARDCSSTLPRRESLICAPAPQFRGPKKASQPHLPPLCQP